MKKFLLHLVLFLSILIGTCLVGVLLGHKRVSAKHFALKPGTQTVILGDSHTETGIDPKLLVGAENLSLAGEPLFYSYFKAKQLVIANAGIERVILGLSYHNLSEFQDDKTDEFFGRYLFYLDFEAGPWLRDFSALEKVCIATSKFMKFYVEELTGRSSSLLNGEYGDMTGSHLSNRSSLDRIQRHYWLAEGEPQTASPVQTLFLKRLAAFLDERGVSLVLVNTPLHPFYLEHVPETHLSYYEETLNELRNEQTERLYVLDYHDFKLEDEMFVDGDHLNREGASLFTAVIRERL